METPEGVQENSLALSIPAQSISSFMFRSFLVSVVFDLTPMAAEGLRYHYAWSFAL